MSNVSGKGTTKLVPLKINGIIDDLEPVSLGAGEEEKVIFRVFRGEKGTYFAEVGEIVENFTIMPKDRSVEKDIVKDVILEVNGENWTAVSYYSLPSRGTWYIYDKEKKLVHTHSFLYYSEGERVKMGRYMSAENGGFFQLKVLSEHGRVKWWPEESEFYELCR